MDSDVARRANYLVNEIKLQRIKGRAVVRVRYYRDEEVEARAVRRVRGAEIIGGRGMMQESDSRMRLSRSAEVALHVRR